MGDLLAFLVVAAEKTPDEEGKDIVLSMLVVGLVFLAVVVLGEVAHRLAYRKKDRR